MNIGSKLVITALPNLLVFTIFSIAHARETGRSAISGSVDQQALQYFAKTEKGDLVEYVKSIRPAGISAEQRSRRRSSNTTTEQASRSRS